MAATDDEILDVIASELQIGRERLKPDATIAALDIASLDMAAVQLALEDRFGVELEQADLQGVETLAQFIAMVQRKASSA